MSMDNFSVSKGFSRKPVNTNMFLNTYHLQARQSVTHNESGMIALKSQRTFPIFIIKKILVYTKCNYNRIARKYMYICLLIFTAFANVSDIE